MSDKKRAHQQPQMTIESLARYVTTASPSTRRVIVRDEKYYDSETQPPYYREVRKSVIRHLCDAEPEDDGLLAAAGRIVIAPGVKVYEHDRLTNNISALKHLHACRTDFIETNVVYAKPEAAGHFPLASVKVIISPVAVIDGQRKGNPFKGCVKLCLGKSRPVDAENAAYIGAALMSFLEVCYPSAVPHQSFVSIIDVFRERTHLAPGATKTRVKNLEAACSDIATLWDSI